MFLYDLNSSTKQTNTESLFIALRLFSTIGIVTKKRCSGVFLKLIFFYSQTLLFICLFFMFCFKQISFVVY